MTKLLIITGSVRKGRIADKVLELVRNELKNYPGIEMTLADLKDMPMRFFDSEIIPSAENYKQTDENALKLSEMVQAADKVLILTPEYNHSTPAVLKNALDWLYREWTDKPVAFIGYGWVGGARSIANIHHVLETAKPQFLEPEGNLRFKQEIDIDGSVIDETAVKNEINKVLEVI